MLDQICLKLAEWVILAKSGSARVSRFPSVKLDERPRGLQELQLQRTSRALKGRKKHTWGGGPLTLTGRPEVAPRVHSNLACSAAGLWEIPVEGGDAGSEQCEEQETTEQPRAPCLPGHGCAKQALLWHSQDAGSRSPPSSLLNYSLERSLPEELAPPPSPAPAGSAPRALLASRGFLAETHHSLACGIVPSKGGSHGY